MFELVRELWPALLALYLVEAAGLVGAGHALYRKHGGPYRRLGAGIRGLGFWPSDRVHTAWPSPPLLAPEGVFLQRSSFDAGSGPFDREAWDFVPWADLRPLALEHHTLRVGERTITAPTPNHALDLVARLKAFRDAEPAERQRRLAADHAARHDPSLLRERLKALPTLLRRLELAAWAGLALYLGVLPAIAYGTQQRGLLLATLAACALGHVLLLDQVFRCGRLLETAGWPKPAGVLLPLLLSPPAVLRSPTALARPLLVAHADETLAIVLLDREAQIPLFRRLLHGARWAASQDGDGGEWSELWRQRETDWQAMLRVAGHDLDQVMAVRASDEEASVVCPLCAAEYAEQLASCRACGGPVVAA
jgi:hypothetical protein